MKEWGRGPKGGVEEQRAGPRPGGGATNYEWVGLRPVGVAYRN